MTTPGPALAAATRAVSDVLVVGYGPVGLVLSNLLASRGWHTTVVERWPAPYPTPRAVSFDGQAARILAAAGVSPADATICEPSADYEVANGAGRTLLRIALRRRGRHGFPDSTSVHLPGLEAALAASGEGWPNLRVLRGHQANRLVDRGSVVEVGTHDATTGRELTLPARWVVGCDGANSFVRGCIGTGWDDAGFSHDWMACDVAPHDPAAFAPCNLQVADPNRPRVAVSAGPRHRRWEFMRLPGEPPTEFGTVERAWRLLGMFGVTPRQGTLSRHAVYRFAARNAQRWRSGRLLLAGDAAHQMPPFAGQGMCSGFRDAANLAWKLDLVLRGMADDAIVDTYEAEGRAQAQRAIDMSVGLGRLVCLVDPAAAARRDAAMLSGTRSGGGPGGPPGDVPVRGFVHRRSGEPVGAAGCLAPQANVAHNGDVRRLDELAGPGFVLVTTAGAEGRDDVVDPGVRGVLGRIGARTVRVLPAGSRVDPASPNTVVDVDDVYLPWLASMAAAAALIRPDFYVFGAARDAKALTELAADLDGQSKRRTSSRP